MKVLIRLSTGFTITRIATTIQEYLAMPDFINKFIPIPPLPREIDLKKSRLILSKMDHKQKFRNNSNTMNFILDKSTPSHPIKKSQMDLRWEHILKHIGFDPECEKRKITSAEIKGARETWTGKAYQFEPRNLCKQDTAEKRPYIFKLYGLCILSIKNGTYLLTKKNIYFPLCKTPTTETIKIKKIHNSCLLSIGDSETSLLDNLRYDGILEDERLIGEKILYGSLLGGRHRCHFKTTLGKTELEIDGSQYETDACYESQNAVCIIEVKSKDVRSFNIRQLYYPYREVYDKAIAAGKKIMCLFIYKDKQKMIHIHKFEWTDPHKMMAIKQVAYFRYQY